MWVVRAARSQANDAILAAVRAARVPPSARVPVLPAMRMSGSRAGGRAVPLSTTGAEHLCSRAVSRSLKTRCVAGGGVARRSTRPSLLHARFLHEHRFHQHRRRSRSQRTERSYSSVRRPPARRHGRHQRGCQRDSRPDRGRLARELDAGRRAEPSRGGVAVELLGAGAGRACRTRCCSSSGSRRRTVAGPAVRVADEHAGQRLSLLAVARRAGEVLVGLRRPAFLEPRRRRRRP